MVFLAFPFAFRVDVDIFVNSNSLCSVALDSFLKLPVKLSKERKREKLENNSECKGLVRQLSVINVFVCLTVSSDIDHDRQRRVLDMVGFLFQFYFNLYN